jgi:hypothetical protein
MLQEMTSFAFYQLAINEKRTLNECIGLKSTFDILTGRIASVV